MGDMFRSEEMSLCQLFIQPEVAYETVADLGESGCVQFRDLNEHVNAFQRKYVSEVRRCEELERRIRYIVAELHKDEIDIPAPTEEAPRAPNVREIIDLEARLESIENELRELAENGVNLQANYRHMTELKQVLVNTEGFFSDEEVINFDSNRRAMNDDPSNAAARGQLAFVAGVIDLERYFAFERMLWRISRGNIFLKRSDLSHFDKWNAKNRPSMKTVFVAFFQGEQLKQRVAKVCTGFRASVYPCPSAHAERQVMLMEVNARLEDLKTVLNQTADHRSRVLYSASRKLADWSIMVRKMKAIFHTLNFFNPDVTGKCLIGEGWVPASDLLRVQQALALGSSKSGESPLGSFMNVIETGEQPPTYTRTNKFTRGFQNLVDAYGIASYREVNPALYTCITFPFLFAVMFGDMGHGSILLLTGLFMILMERQLSNVKGEIFNLFFSGRYLIFLMGCFSLYTGFIYNDVFSKSMNIFGSGWRVHIDNKDNATYMTLSPKENSIGTYIFGMDPIWQMAENKILFLNSFKMKMSIIFGVVHMVGGVMLSCVNFAYFRRPSSMLLEFLPQLLFLVLLFGYLVFMMFYKWLMYSENNADPAFGAHCAPSILVIFINMMMFRPTEAQEGCLAFMFEGQEMLQMVFVVVALLCIPVMLFGKPIYIALTRPKYTAVENSMPVHGGGHGSGNEPMGEIMTMQAIHTIEYVLSTISHTASYLRLWALSLAHAQLSEVLWTMVFSKCFVIGATIGYGGSILVYIVFAMWAVLTIGVLVVIEGLSAFLHTLRLHWVEFMSKFYDGNGYPFEPFSLEKILQASDEDVI